MKYLKYILILLFLPVIILAEECDTSKISITEIEKREITGNTEIIEEPEVEDLNIGFNIKMYKPGDSITYDMVIKNESEEDYMIDDDSFKTDSEYIEYSLKTEDNSNVVEAQKSKGVSLSITYKKEVDASLLTNNKYDASNSLKLSLNTIEEEKELAVITTDNIKQSVEPEVKNPVTGVTNIKLVVAILMIVIIIISLTYYGKKQYIKYFLILISLSVIPAVYAICKADLEVYVNIEIEKLPNLYDKVFDLSKEGNSCITKYEGNVTDEVGKTVPATKVYFDNCLEGRNVIFGGHCWQVIRTTETGGTKILYNGASSEGACNLQYENSLSLYSEWETYNETEFNQEFLYSKSFDYDLANDTFTLIDPVAKDSSFLNADEYYNYFTCKNTTGTCSTLFNLKRYNADKTPSLIKYMKTDYSTYYPFTAIASFNYTHSSPALTGYMYNKVYTIEKKTRIEKNVIFGHNFTYNRSTSTYTLTEDTVVINDWASDYNKIYNTHYTCMNTTGTCEKIYYVFDTNYDAAGYIELSGGKSIADALDEMINNQDINTYDSSVKVLLDTWYRNYLYDYKDKIEDTVYCNARNVTSLGGWNPSGGRGNLVFNNDNQNSDLSCPRILDQFAMSNTKAKLTYPVALITNPEENNLSKEALQTTGEWWNLSPTDTFYNGSSIGCRYWHGGVCASRPSSFMGVRPVVSLNKNALIISGDGSEEHPWIIK